MTGDRNINRKHVNYRKAGKIKKKLHKQQIKKAALSNKTTQPKSIEDMTKKDRRELIKKKKIVKEIEKALIKKGCSKRNRGRIMIIQKFFLYKLYLYSFVFQFIIFLSIPPYSIFSLRNQSVFQNNRYIYKNFNFIQYNLSFYCQIYRFFMIRQSIIKSQKCSQNINDPYVFLSSKICASLFLDLIKFKQMNIIKTKLTLKFYSNYFLLFLIKTYLQFIMKLIIAFLILLNTFAFIKYDSGLALDFNSDSYPTFKCYFGYSKIAVISFSNAFENIPQVFFYHEYFDQEVAEAELKLSITTITKTSFTSEIYCGQKRVRRLKIRWFALDDQRIEVINNFNMVNPDDKTFTIKNPNAKFGFIVLTSIHYSGAVDFQLSMSSITMNTVTVTITKVAGKFVNLKQVGYQVIVGVEEAFIKLGLQTSTGTFISGNISKQPNRWFVIAVQSITFPNTTYLTLEALFTYTATTLSYTWKSFLNSQTPNKHEQVWVAYQFTTTYKPLECFSIRTSRKQAFDLTILPTFFLQLVQTNQIYFTNGNYEYVVDKSITPLKMNIQMKCENGKKVQADFNKCNACSIQKTYSFTYNCFNQMNYIGFFPLFQQAFQQYNHLKINIQSSSLEIINVVYDQAITEKTIVKIQILNL
ncbi:unnamed protein product [Paramecium pentaurelia]|uniref:H-type lectin domain-containing protein n=1 Tax=Paramecium pentaurelia TaxID=43138 RepID=A0A8S1UZ27_9CILI|nr:unnamed protein product [Paramecium pentaurelia]